MSFVIGAVDETTLIVVAILFAVTYASGASIVAFVAVTELKLPDAVGARNSLFAPSGNANSTITGTSSPTTKTSVEAAGTTDADDGTARTVSAAAYTTVSIGVASGLVVRTPSTSGAVVRATTVHVTPDAVRETLPLMSAVSETTPSTPYSPAPSSIETVTGTPVPTTPLAVATALAGGAYTVTPVPTVYVSSCAPSESTSVATCGPAATVWLTSMNPAPVATVAAAPSTLALAVSNDPAATPNRVTLVSPTLIARAAVVRVSSAGNARAATPSVNTVPGPTTVSCSVPLVALAVSATRTVVLDEGAKDTDPTARPVPTTPTLWLAVARTNSNPEAELNATSCVVSRPTTAPAMLVGLTALATS